MKRVLLLTYHVPPRRGIASVRVEQIFRLLPRFGYEVVAATPDLGDVEFGTDVVTTGVIDFKEPLRRALGVRTGESTSVKYAGGAATATATASLRSRAIGMTYELTEYANRQFGWVGPGSKAIEKLLQSERFDAIISTSPPEGVHAVAARVAKDLPWIADLRDPWIGRGARSFVYGALDRLLEPQTLQGASAITTVSEAIESDLAARYPRKHVRCIRNAFNAEDWNDVPFTRPAKATFLYAGQLYGMRRDPRGLFAALRELREAGAIDPATVDVRFYGDTSEWLGREIVAFGLGDIVSMHPSLPRDEILCLERSATRLLLFLASESSERATYTGKFFEYLGSRRPILVVGGPKTSVLDPVLAQTNAGVRVRSQQELRAEVLRAVADWKNGADDLTSPAAIVDFESAKLAAAFAEVLDEITRL